ncbi:ubiquitin--protein ligase [Corallincola luteus]|uniref:Ubiquitin--protein ligase n=4 Tax=Psychromonadaceae TaxID=267894 RepID=A0A368NH13_9GAMM|nr:MULTISPECIES: zinc ribbon domain-containing protein [Corallincola]RCU48924.1 ubiquitin--protein ligase [Corallincola holothuriorum]TAA42751.1 ubiquitin--protein ligase [Corallincola spongiicola]TCI01734.1 ubiquitin--protein ligase [Corallincola luteus]
MSYTHPHCPECHGLLQAENKQLHCPACQADYVEKVCCDVCGEQVETLKACGAVDYFCNHCNSLKSKSKVVRSYHMVNQ